MAFNNIYVTIAEQAGRQPQLQMNPDGSVKTRAIGHVDMPKVKTVSEKEQLDLVFQSFSEDLNRRIVEHVTPKLR